MHLKPKKIPPQLHHLIGRAEKFGIADDWARDDLVASCSPEERRLLKDVVARYNDEFDLWLDGPESEGSAYSDEYIAFSALRMAADFA